MKPFLKWAGGKTQLLPELRKYSPPKFNRYYEPFVGAGARLFDLRPERAVINDINGDLINCYQVIKLWPLELVSVLQDYINSESVYYLIRDMDRKQDFKYRHPIIKAARFVYLNKNGFNGLCRYNSKGQFNVPYGKHKNDYIPDIETITAVSQYLNQNNVTIHNMDFENSVVDARAGDFVYFDPPYHPASETANFTAYTAGGFALRDQIRLMETAIKLHERGVYVMISNSHTTAMTALYSVPVFTIHQVQAKRNINSKGDNRGNVGELIITSY